METEKITEEILRAKFAALPEFVRRMYSDTYSRVNHRMAFLRVWDTLSNAAQARFDGDAFTKCGGTVGFWMALRGVSRPRAVIALGRKTGQLSNSDARILERHLAGIDPSAFPSKPQRKRESHDATEIDDQIRKAVGSRSVVVVHGGGMRGVFWNGGLVKNSGWAKHPRCWDFMLLLCQKATLQRGVCWNDMEGFESAHGLTALRSRLKSHLPQKLNAKIVSDDSQQTGYRLAISKEEVTVIELGSDLIPSFTLDECDRSPEPGPHEM